MEQKLTIGINQRINTIMNVLDKALREKYDGDKEFCGLLIAPRENPWMCEDMIIPKQKVTGGSVDLPKDGKYSPYQRFFEEYITKSKTHVVIGTIHSHNDMGTFFSSGDDEDLDNNAFLNINEGLPFIDIVWSHKENEYKGRVKLKIGKGVTKQIFTHEDCEVIMASDKPTLKLLEKIKTLLGKKYAIDENQFSKSIHPVIDISGMIKNIEVEKSTTYSNYSDTDTSDILKTGGDVTIDLHFKKKDKLMVFGCQGIDTEEFVEVVEDCIRESTDYDVQSTSCVGDKTTLEIECDSNNKYKKLRNEIFKLHEKFLTNGKLEKKVVDDDIVRQQDLYDYEDYMVSHDRFGKTEDISSKGSYPHYVG